MIEEREVDKEPVYQEGEGIKIGHHRLEAPASGHVVRIDLGTPEEIDDNPFYDPLPRLVYHYDDSAPDTEVDFVELSIVETSPLFLSPEVNDSSNVEGRGPIVPVVLQEDEEVLSLLSRKQYARLHDSGRFTKAELERAITYGAQMLAGVIGVYISKQLNPKWTVRRDHPERFKSTSGSKPKPFLGTEKSPGPKQAILKSLEEFTKEYGSAITDCALKYASRVEGFEIGDLEAVALDTF